MAKEKLDSTKDAILIGRNYLTGKLRDGTIELSICEEEESNRCNDVITLIIASSAEGEINVYPKPRRQVFNDVFYIPTDVETIVKYRYTPPIEPYMFFTAHT